MDQNLPKDSSVSFIIEQDIPSDKTEAFLQWEAEITALCHQFEGFLKTDNFPPTPGIRDKWYTVIHFDTPENLTRWLESETRHQLIKKRKNKLGIYRFVGYKTGFEEWFSHQKTLPKWKQALAVLFGLYPTVMLETMLFTHWRVLESWSLASSMLVNNLLSCFALTWIVMPLVNKMFSFWLEPPEKSGKLDKIGTLLIIVGLSLMVSLFTAFT